MLSALGLICAHPHRLMSSKHPVSSQPPSIESDLLDGSDPGIYSIRTNASGPAGSLPLTEQMLRNWASGDLFGLTQDAGMGWDPRQLGRPEFLILSTSGGLRADDGT